jgi:hypothetical protein
MEGGVLEIRGIRGFIRVRVGEIEGLLGSRRDNMW